MVHRLKHQPPPSGPDWSLQMKQKSFLADGLFGQSNPTASGKRLKTPAPKTLCPTVTHPTEPTLVTATGCQSQGAHRERSSRRLNVLVANQNSSGRGAHLEVIFRTWYLPGERETTHALSVIFEKAGIGIPPPMCKVQKYPMVVIPVFSEVPSFSCSIFNSFKSLSPL